MINAVVNVNNWLIKVDMIMDGFIWNPSICECECDESCNVEQYLDYKNFKCSWSETNW